MRPEHFGPRLKQLRLNAGLTVERAAKNAGVSDVTWTRWEKNRTSPQLTRADEIANALGIPTAALTAPDSVHVIADIVVSDQTYQRVRQQGGTALDELTAASSTAIEQALRQHFSQATHEQAGVRRRSGPSAASRRSVHAARAGSAARLERERAQQGLQAHEGI